MFGAAMAAQAPIATPEHAAEFVEVHCIDCHEGDSAKGGLDLTQSPAGSVAQLWRWSRMRERVQSFEMPPVDASDVDVTERRRFATWVEQMLQREVPRLPVAPGNVTVRRLSRGQWQNAVVDLLGVEIDTSGFPADDLGYGFDSIGDALTFSTLHLENYLAAARDVARQVFHGEDPEQPVRRRFDAGAMHLVDDRGASMRGDSANLFTNATIEQVVNVPRDGRYRLVVTALGRQAGDEPAKMLPEVDRARLQVIEVPNVKARAFSIDLDLREGQRRIGLSFVNDYYEPKNPDRKRRDRNLVIESLEVVGPLDARPVPAQQQWLRSSVRGSSQASQLRSMVRVMLPRLWRRSVTGTELQRMQRAGIARLELGESRLMAQRFVLTAALTSPHFLFRVEQSASMGGEAAGASPLAGRELATRLSFFLWASAPDADLIRWADKADQRASAWSAELAAQVDRMLADPRSSRLATDFAVQWFELRALADAAPDPARFAGFDEELRRSLRRESELLFLAVLREARDVRELLDCDFTHVNAKLRQFYGLPAREAEHSGFERVTLVGDLRTRGGLLGHGSLHAITSNPTRTSPVKRGKWMLENLLGQAPPPPPPGNDSFADEDAIDNSATLREQMAQHRQRSKCAVCHVRMDALGLALERFDAIGRYRATDKAGAIDVSGELPDGRKLDGLLSLKRVLAADPAFVRTAAKKLFVYAVGRDLLPVDHLRIDVAVRGLLARGKVTLRDLILVVVNEPAFAMRAGSVRAR